MFRLYDKNVRIHAVEKGWKKFDWNAENFPRSEFKKYGTLFLPDTERSEGCIDFTMTFLFDFFYFSKTIFRLVESLRYLHVIKGHIMIILQKPTKDIGDWTEMVHYFKHFSKRFLNI